MADFDLVRRLQDVRAQSGGAQAPFTQPAPPAAPSGGGGGGGSPSSGPPLGDTSLKAYVQREAAKYGWSGGEWNNLDELIQRESSWRPTIKNPNSTAWGLFQFLDMHYGPGKYLPNGRNSTVPQQVAGGLRYIKERYGSPSRAIAHHNRMNWY